MASLVVAGGIGFAASSAIESSQVSVKRVAGDGAREIAVRNAARAVYVDEGPVQTQPGAPAVTVTQKKDASGDPVPLVAKATPNDPDVTLTASMTVNESGTLSIQVLGEDGVAVLIDCKRTLVRGGEVGTREATICRTVVNTPGTITVSIKVPARTLEAGEKLTIRLGYTDKDASAKRTVVDLPAAAPAKLPMLTRTFRLSAEDVADIRDGLADRSTIGVTFRAFVTPADAEVTITWPGTKKTTGRTVGPIDYAKQAAVDSTAVVTVTGGEIGGGDFTIVDRTCRTLKDSLELKFNGDRGVLTGRAVNCATNEFVQALALTGNSSFGIGNTRLSADGTYIVNGIEKYKVEGRVVAVKVGKGLTVRMDPQG